MTDDELLKEAEANLKALCDFVGRSVSLHAACNGRSVLDEMNDPGCQEAKVFLPAIETLKKIRARLNP